MCYDISFNTKVELITDYLPELDIDPQISIGFEPIIHAQAQAFRKHPVIFEEDGKNKLRLFEWGIIPEYMNTPEKIKRGRNSMCNARSEKIIEDKRSYWHRIRKKRGLLPVTGIFEHREVQGFKNKIPYLVSLKSRGMFCLPVLFHFPNKADVETGEVTGTFSIVTRAANPVMKQIHNSGDQAFRMPLFLPKEKEIEWLEPGLSDAELAKLLDFEMPADELNYHPVFTIRTTKPRPDGKEKVEAYDWPNLPPLGVDSVEQRLF